MIKIQIDNIDEICNSYADYVCGLNRIGKTVFWDFLDGDKLRKIITCKPQKLSNIILDFYKVYGRHYDTDSEWHNFKNYMINQYYRVMKDYSYKLFEQLDVRVCPYCNREYTFTTKRNNRRIHPQFDHFFDKSTYPFLALSFYNLIPCCPTCNMAKRNDRIRVNPYLEGFSDNSRFVIDNVFNCLAHNEHYPWNIRVTKDKKSRTNIRSFLLDKLYEHHKDYAEEIVFKALAYENDALVSLKDICCDYGLKNDEIERIIWGNYMNKSDFGKRPLSKFTYDIAEQVKNNID